MIRLWASHVPEDEFRDEPAYFAEELARSDFALCLDNHGCKAVCLESSTKKGGMAAYTQVQQAEFAHEVQGRYHAVKPQQFVGTGYFDQVTQCVSAGKSSTRALTGSTEEEQFEHMGAGARRGATDARRIHSRRGVPGGEAGSCVSSTILPNGGRDGHLCRSLQAQIHAARS